MARKRSAKNPWHGCDGFAGIPKFIMRSEEYLSLSSNALRLLLEAAYQYNSKNNGNISFSYSDMKHRGYSSKSTLFRARDELFDKGFLEITRAGYAGIEGKRQCTLFALTYYPIDDIPNAKLDCKPTNKPSRPSAKWKIRGPKMKPMAKK